ncbi:MAG: VTC domain-containing protein [Candidatus Latescibacteria bacterium]|nr:VTC domain-containing protein [Candidatus Latescibacterota bacterium]NIO56540.1 VTC domain-containing protein [Candidatus Latescibacterota bacterium]
MRLEYKYLIPMQHLPEIQAILKPYLQMDKFAAQRETKEYTVRSIYFDTLELDYYFEKIEGLKIRKKIRVRGYNEHSEQSVIFLEIKRKCANYIHKNRATVLHCDLFELFRTGDIERYILSHDGYAGSQKHARQFFYYVFGKSLRPSMLVAYERQAFYSKFDPALRVTFDKNIRFSAHPSLCNLFEEKELQFTRLKGFIFEIKFQRGLPHWLQELIKRYRLNRIPLSKYTICLDASKKLKGINGRGAKYA